MNGKNGRSITRRWMALCAIYSLLLVSSIVLFLTPIPANDAQLGATLLVWLAMAVAVVCVRTSDSDYSRAAAGLILMSGAIGVAVICASILSKSGIIMFPSCCLVLIALVSMLLPAVVSEGVQKNLNEVIRGQSRFSIVLMVGVGILCCGIYVALTCWRYSERQAD